MDPALLELLRGEEVLGDRVVEAIVRLRWPTMAVPGVRIVSRFGTIATCRLAMSRIREVRGHANVVSLKASRPLGPQFEPSPADSQGVALDLGRTDVRRSPGLPLTGRGVVVGVVDWGLDFDHPNFRAWDGSTRLRALWDQRTNTRGGSPRPFGYGTVHRQEQINQALRTSRPYGFLGYHPAAADRGGGSHGTHVMDIAAGSGRAGPAGVAPEADLVFVHLADHDTGGLANLGDSVRLLEAVDFISRAAGNRPWVVNVSVGQHAGPHDGTTLVELAFDNLLSAAPGRMIVQSAGNYYESRTHACGLLKEGQERTLTFVTDQTDKSVNELEIWYDGDDEFVVRIDPPGGNRTRSAHLGSQTEIVVGNQVVGRVYHRAHDPNNNDNHVDAFLLPLGHAGSWTVTIQAKRVKNGHFHAWLERDQACGMCQSRFIPEDSNQTCTTGTIANGRLPLVVGAYDGHSASRPVAAFSSSGPTSDDRCKPDLGAPGLDVLAARSAPRGSASSRGELVRKSGTSMAAPHVAGSAALCLQQGGDRLGAQQIRSLVLGSAASPKPEDSARLGHGYLDIPKLVAAVQTAAPSDNDTKEFTMDPHLDATDPLVLAPSRVFREVMYRPDGPESQWIDQRFDIIVRPGQRLDDRLKAGDMMLQVELGRPGSGECWVMTDSILTRQRANGAHGSPGWYATAVDASAPATPQQRRVLDPSLRVPPGQLLIRSITTGAADGPTEHEYAEEAAEARTSVSVDVAAAVPPFAPTERTSVLGPLLSARESARAVAWTRRTHPSISGVTADEIRGALVSYVDATAVQGAIEARNKQTPGDQLDASTQATDAVLVECVHQFQMKCYSEEREHDGQSGESTLDSLGLIARAGSGLRSADRGNPNAQQRLTRRDPEIRSVTGNEHSAANWFDRMADPSVFGLRTKLGRGLHAVLLRKLRQAERHLLTLPEYHGMTPVGLGRALGVSEKHGGSRPAQTQSTSVHTFGLAIDIEYTANPWVRSSASWTALKRSAQLISGTNLAHASAPEYFSSLGSDTAKSTGQVWDELQLRNAELIAYLALGNDHAMLRAALQSGRARGTAGLVDSGESLDDAAVKWRTRIRQDRRALEGGDFAGHRSPAKGFLTLRRDLVIALRDHGCLVWGAVDLGPGAGGSGDMMHFDARIDGAGRVLTAHTKAFIPTVGHPCLSAASILSGAPSTETSAEDEAGAETAPDKAKDTIRAQAKRLGTDEAGVMAALRALRPSEMAELSADPATVGILRDELSGSDLTAAGTQLARGRVGLMGRADIDQILTAPDRHSFGTLAAANARDVLLGHQEAFDRTGTGTLHGSHCSTPKPAGTATSDCTEFVKDVLKRTFTAKGQAGAWAEVLKEATTRSGTRGLKGTEVIKALQTKQGWEALFWAPDPRIPADGQAEHSYAYKIVLQQGTYYGIAVDKTKSVIDYRRTNVASASDLSGIERLRRLQFGVLATRGGKHMALIINGAVYEVHWTSPATDRNAIEATPLENYTWLSGTIAAPPGDLALAWRTP